MDWGGDAEALDAAAVGGYYFKAEADGFEDGDLACERDAAFDLTDQTAEGCGFIAIADLRGFTEEIG